ncbi:hypothetical protein AB1Y20_022993 [Prymnesium parvum]|uniref:Mediator of RNA polymerase II transcription subunit 31 n=1 Tax=Prymnesium parvum TaxID=97485 RepID=A0AB34JFT3_PRYPA
MVESSEKVRFEAELEFVQSLANPNYLHYLAQHRYLDDPDFVEYLDYLQYWRDFPYCSFIVFPHCLRMLELLQQDSFRAALKRADFKDFIFQQQHWHWKYRQCTHPSESLSKDNTSHTRADGVTSTIGT